jgi:hypothetical protein
MSIIDFPLISNTFRIVIPLFILITTTIHPPVQVSLCFPYSALSIEWLCGFFFPFFIYMPLCTLPAFSVFAIRTQSSTLSSFKQIKIFFKHRLKHKSKYSTVEMECQYFRSEEEGLKTTGIKHSQ